jgi:hypothetical protein
MFLPNASRATAGIEDCSLETHETESDKLPFVGLCKKVRAPQLTSFCGAR